MPNTEPTTFINNNENTMNPYTVASVAAVLLRLARTYLNVASVEEKEKIIWDTLEIIKQVFRTIFSNDPDLNKVIPYIDEITNTPANKLDEITIYFEGQHIKRVILLKEVLVIVFLALNDHDKFPTVTLFERLLPLFNSLNDLRQSGRCHTGRRHDKVLCLNHVYPDINIIEDIDDYLTYTLVDYIERNLKKILPELQFIDLYDCLHYGKQQRDAYKSLIAPLQDRARELLHQRCYENGLNPQDEYFKDLLKKIDHFTSEDALAELPAPVGIHKYGPPLQRLMKLLDKDCRPRPDPVVVPHLHIVEQILNTCRSFDDLASKKLMQWIEYYEAWLTIKEYRQILALGQDEHVLQEIITTLTPLLTSYFTQFPMVENRSEIELLIARLYAQIGAAKQSLSTQFVENFFALWNNTHDDGITQYKLYRRILLEKNKLVLSDNQLHRLIESNREAHVINLTPFIINRILLHAILISPRDWTETFYSCFTRVNRFIGDRFRSEGMSDLAATNADNLLNSSYTEILSEQLAFLEYAYNENRQPGQNVRPDMKKFLVPANLKDIQCDGLEYFIFIMNHMPEFTEQVFISILSLYDMFCLHAKNQYLELTLAFMPPAYLTEYLAKLGANNLQQLFSDHQRLAFLLHDIALLIQRNFPDINEGQHKLITGFNACFEALGQQYIITIIRDAPDFYSILDRIPVIAYRAFILAIDRGHLRQIITTDDNLVTIFRNTREAGWLNIIQAIGVDHINTIIFDTYRRYARPSVSVDSKRFRLNNILDNLPAKAWYSLIVAIGIDNIKRFIGQYRSILSFIVQEALVNQLDEFFESLDQEKLIQLIADYKDLAMILRVSKTLFH